MAFNGVNQYIESPSSATHDLDRFNPFTLSTRVKIDTHGDTGLITKWEFVATVGKGFYMGLTSGGNIRVSLQVNGGITAIIVNSVPTLSLGVPYHIACTYDGSSTAAGVKIYINGLPVSTSIMTDTLSFGSIINPTPLMFGTYKDLSLYFDGTLNVSRGWDFKMSDADVLADYNGGVPTFPTFLPNMIIGNAMGDGGIFGTDTWVFADESSTVTGYQGVNLVYADRVAAI
jgi:hypothetical protein